MGGGPSEEPLELFAYHAGPEPSARLVPAATPRDWMSGVGSYAKRCMPLLLANQAGWVMLNTHRVSLCWDGGDGRSAVQVEYPDGPPPVFPAFPRAVSHFGLGVVTWPVPYLFRTPPGYNLLARGPANTPKDGIAPLEGLVETDWSVAAFTMNWKLTRPHLTVTFEVGEPFCMVVPQRRGELEAFEPKTGALRSNSALHEATKAWTQRRHDHLVGKFLSEHTGDGPDKAPIWEMDYAKGVTPDGEEAPEHQRRLRLREFGGTSAPVSRDS